MCVCECVCVCVCVCKHIINQSVETVKNRTTRQVVAFQFIGKV